MAYPGLNYLAPGVRDSVETFENVVQFGDPLRANFFKFGALIDGASRDLANTGSTNILRPGLLMSYNASKWIPYNTAGVGTTDAIQGILYESINMFLDGQDVDRQRGFIIMPGSPIKMSALITNDGTPGPVVGHASEGDIRTALTALNYLADDWYQQ